ncbi:MAG: hypothetical protein KKI09_08210 [Spirochaetes bacterium]|nr:hypothetical protein [Spirochaetota bacterium]MBU0955395.1 hypothetical protein [Spirochaetota bacterium]
MFLQIWFALAVVFVFYFCIPIIGALAVRKKWRDFRALVFEAALLPRLSAETVFRNCLQDGQKAADSSGRQIGLFSAYGTIDAIGPESRLWLRIPDATCSVFMNSVPVYLLSGIRDETITAVDPETDVVESLKWKSLPSIPQGARLFVAGSLVQCDGTLCFQNMPEQPLLVILHDGIDEYVLPRAIIAGRHRNEYWNSLTQVSLAIGILLISILLTGGFSGRSLVFVRALNITLAFTPVLVVLPPGFLLFFLYRRLWISARRYRAERDIARLRGDDYLPWRRRSIAAFLGSLSAFAAGLLINAVLLFFVLRAIL